VEGGKKRATSHLDLFSHLRETKKSEMEPHRHLSIPNPIDREGKPATEKPYEISRNTQKGVKRSLDWDKN